MASEARRALARLVALLATAWPVAAALAADPVVVPARDVLRPGRPAVVYVAADAGDPPSLEVEGGAVQRIGPVVEGVEAWWIRPPVGADVVRLRAGAIERAVPVELPPVSSLRLPGDLVGLADGGPVVFRVTGDSLPPPEALQVAVGEGSVVGVEAVDGALEVRVQPERTPFPRVIPVGVRDARRDERPRWGLLRLDARPVVPVETEPGASVSLRVGDRHYGLFRASHGGVIRARIDQRPGEKLATAVITDRNGNETWVDLPLAVASQPRLAALPEGEILPGEPPPPVWLHLVRADGTPVTSEPSCRTSAGELPVHDLGGGDLLLVPPVAYGDLDATCAVEGSTRNVRVPFAEGVPARIRTRVWPDELRADHPVAEVRAELEDGRGALLPPVGLSLRAERGAIATRVEDGALVGEYRGEAAVADGHDVVVARWVAEGPGSWPHRLEVGWTAGPDELLVHGRALDPNLRPVADVPLTFVLGDEVLRATTGPDGWATARVPGEPPPALRVVRVVGPHVEHAAPLLPGTSRGGPGAADRTAREPLRILPGRTVGIALEVVPPVLRAGPGARARILVRLEDRSGRRVEDRPVELDVSAGAVGALLRRPDGSFVAEYDPGRVDRAGEIVVTASTEELRSSTTFRVEPRDLRAAVGLWAGLHTNLGAITAPVVGADGEIRFRSPWFGDQAIVRLGASTYLFETVADTSLPDDPRIRSRVVPVTAALAFRQDVGAFDVLAGAGAAVGVHAYERWFGSTRVGGGTAVLAGPHVTAGAARAWLGGEITLTLRGTWLIQRPGEFGLDGNIGGLSTGIGYRLDF